MTLLGLRAFTDGPFQSKAGSVLKKATFHCNICRNLFSTSFAELVEFSFLLITLGFFARGIALNKNLMMLPSFFSS